MRLGARITTMTNWARRNSSLIACLFFLVLNIAILLVWALQPDLTPFLGSQATSVILPPLSSWHWLGAFLAVSGLTLLTAIQIFGWLRGCLLSSVLAMLGAATGWFSLELGLLTSLSVELQGAMLVAFWGGWIVFQTTTFDLIWADQKPEDGSPPSRIVRESRDRSFIEHFVFLFCSLIGLTLIASVWLWPGTHLDQRQAFDNNLFAAATFSVLVATAFYPLVRGIWLRAREDAAISGRKFWRPDVISPLSFAAIVSTFGGVSALAYFAAKYVSEEISVAISYATFVGVFVLFLIVISAPHAINYYRTRSEHQHTQFGAHPPAMSGFAIPLHAPAEWLSYLDTFLVKVIAPLSGGTQKHFAHLHVVMILGFLSLLGLILPRPFGLVPITIGIALAIALGRRWAWIEEDRETASRLEQTNGPNIHLGFESDLKDEALTGYVGLFILVPLTLYQIQDITGFQPRLTEQSGNILFVWIAFFGGELAKAVPFVDWWDIYGNSDVSSTGKHLTFASRAAVDLIILAALFQALKIWQRNRVQSLLFADGHLEAFDPFKEREFFNRGIIKLKEVAHGNSQTNSPENLEGPLGARIESLRKEKRLVVLPAPGQRTSYFEIRKSFVKKIEEHVSARRDILREASSVYESPSPYSRQRLAELIQHPNDADLRAGAQWMVDRWGVLVGTPLDQLSQIAQRWHRAQFPNDDEAETPKSINDRRIQKMEFERILVELASSKWVKQVRSRDLSNLMSCLRRVRSEVEFDFSRILALEIFARLRTAHAVYFLSKFVLKDSHLEQNEDWRLKLIANVEGPDTEMRLGRAEMRSRAYDAAASIARNISAGDLARTEALYLLEWMSDGDGALESSQRANELAEASRAALDRDGLV